MAKTGTGKAGTGRTGTGKTAGGKSADKALRKAVIAACREMNALGINQGTSGNVSARTADPERFVITPSGMPYDALSASDMVEMDLGGGYRGDRLPSSEWRMHLDIYRARPEAGAVVHTHAPYATALSCLRVDIPAFHYMIAVAGGTTIRCADYATFGTAELSRAMVAALEGRSACLLANHGMIAFGPTLAKALALAVEVETLARQYWMARQMGEPVILDDAEMQRVLARFKTYGKQADELAGTDAPAVEAPVRRDAPATGTGEAAATSKAAAARSDARASAKAPGKAPAKDAATTGSKAGAARKVGGKAAAKGGGKASGKRAAASRGAG
ncbi:MAG: class II aldolase/adducin family protein [Azospirillaceae bacterium]